MNTCRLLLPLLCLALSCRDAGEGSRKEPVSPAPEAGAEWAPPPAGTVVAADSMLITDDPLNRFHFTVKLVSSKLNEGGSMGFIYDIRADFGPNTADGKMAMPKGGRNLKPVLRPATDGSYAYIIGFIPGPAFGGDTTFHDYYEVRGSKSAIEIRALKAYVFE